MHEGKLIQSVLITKEGEPYYVERVSFKDWHISLHNFYLISDRLCTGCKIIDQKWNYNDFCDITIRLEDHTFLLNRQVEDIVLVRNYISTPIDDFERIARPLLYTEKPKRKSICKYVKSLWDIFVRLIHTTFE